jgi:hypothetical protein
MKVSLTIILSMLILNQCTFFKRCALVSNELSDHLLVEAKRIKDGKSIKLNKEMGYIPFYIVPGRREVLCTYDDVSIILKSFDFIKSDVKRKYVYTGHNFEIKLLRHGVRSKVEYDTKWENNDRIITEPSNDSFFSDLGPRVYIKSENMFSFLE